MTDGQLLIDRALDFSTDDVWSRCPLCGHRCLIPYGELYGDERLCPSCNLSVAPGQWQTDAIDLAQTAASVDWIRSVSWFHTSTHRSWPPSAATARDRAIHLGTYEAAADSMLYRMASMAEAHRSFYLHRVVLPAEVSIDPRMSEDRGSALTGFVDLSIVASGGYDGYRYVNREEHRGSVSLAVDPKVIFSVQTLAIPRLQLLTEVEARGLAAVLNFEAAVASADAALTDSDRRIPPASLEVIFGRTDGGQRVAERNSRFWNARDALYDELDAVYLPDVGPRHRELFRRAVRAMLPQRFAGSRAHNLYRLHSSTISRGNDVVKLVAKAPAHRPTIFDP